MGRSLTPLPTSARCSHGATPLCHRADLTTHAHRHAPFYASSRGSAHVVTTPTV